MTDNEALWEIQEIISLFHLPTMFINAAVLAYCMFKDPKTYCNLHNVSNKANWLLITGALIIPLYYTIENYTMINLCLGEFKRACPFMIHHTLTGLLSVVLFYYRLFNGLSMLACIVHGIMNVGYYYVDLVRYYFCKWYFATTLIYEAYITYQAFNRNNSLKTRIGSGMMALMLIPLGINNAFTPELADMCTYDDTESYFIRMEFIIHALYFGSMARIFMKYTTCKEEKPTSFHKYYI